MVSQDSAGSWKQWRKDFIHGRTHVAYGLIISTVISSVGVIIEPSVLVRTLFLISSLSSAGSLVDTVAHLYYH